jgi:hypothetical protein
MKTIYSCILFAALSCITVQNASAQVWLGLYGFRANSTNYVNPDIGGGFAMSFLSKEQSFAKAPATVSSAVADKVKSPLQWQMGMNFYWSGLGHRTFENVPLTSQPGAARCTINNSFVAFNMMGRISAPNKTIFTPYLDVFGGYRGTFSSLAITPYQHDISTKTQTNQNLATVTGLNYGFGGGITTNLNKQKSIKLDLGVSYIEQVGGGQMADLQSAWADNSGINLNMKHAPNGIVMLNVGLLFYLESDDDDDCDCHCRHHYSSYSSGARVGGGYGTWGGGGRSSSVGVHIGGGGGGFGGVRVK